MIDTFQAKTTSKTLYLKTDGIMVAICEKMKKKDEKGRGYKLIDLAMGSVNGIINDLKSRGYKIKIIK